MQRSRSWKGGEKTGGREGSRGRREGGLKSMEWIRNTVYRKTYRSNAAWK